MLVRSAMNEGFPILTLDISGRAQVVFVKKQ